MKAISVNFTVPGYEKFAQTKAHGWTNDQSVDFYLKNKLNRGSRSIRYADEIFDFGNLYDAIHDGIIDSERDWFRTGGHGYWDAQHPATTEHSAHGRLLDDTGALLDSLENKSSPDHIFDFTQSGDTTRVIYGSRVEYLPYVHFGYQHEIRSVKEAVFLSALFGSFVMVGSIKSVPERPVYPPMDRGMIEKFIKKKKDGFFKQNFKKFISFFRKMIG